MPGLSTETRPSSSASCLRLLQQLQRLFAFVFAQGIYQFLNPSLTSQRAGAYGVRERDVHNKTMPTCHICALAVHIRQLGMFSVCLADLRFSQAFRAGHFHYSHYYSFQNRPARNKASGHGYFCHIGVTVVTQVTCLIYKVKIRYHCSLVSGNTW